MSGASAAPQAGRATVDLRSLAAAMLDCALQPSFDPAAAETLLETVAVLGHGRTASHGRAGGAFAFRHGLVMTAEALLDYAAASADGDQWLRAQRALALAEGWLPQMGLTADEAVLTSLQHGLGLMTTAAPDRLAAEMRRYRDEPLEHMVDAHELLRLVAAAWHLAQEGKAALPAVAELLEQPEAQLAVVMDGVMDGLRLPSTARTDADLRRSIDRFRGLEMLLLPLADADSSGTALSALEHLLPPWLGQAVLPLRVEADGRLTLHGQSDLAGQRVRVEGGKALAARAVREGRLVLAEGADIPTAPVFDRQCAERLGAASMLALPLGAPEPVAVLLTAAGLGEEDLKLLSVHAGRWLQRLAQLESQWQGQADAQRDRFTLSMREAVLEISNPLTVIQNYVHLLSSRLPAEDSTQEPLRLIGDELRRATGLLRGLTVAGPSEPDAAADLDLNALLTDMLRLFQSSLPTDAGIDVRFRPEAGLPNLELHEQSLRQVILNLLRNAVEAMPDGGALDLGVHQAVDDRGRRGVEISVTDTGVGIDPGRLGHIFESGVSAKGAGRGLGLAVSSRLVAEMGGAISCRSRLGAGSTFTLWLPAR